MRPEKTPSRSARRQRLGVDPCGGRLVVHPLATPERRGLYKGYRLMGIDGTVMDVPDSPAMRSVGRVAVAVVTRSSDPQLSLVDWAPTWRQLWPSVAITTRAELVVQLFDRS